MRKVDPGMLGSARQKKVELLAPAADSRVMRACMNAGADAVYMGLSRFSARAFALNESVEGYKNAIDYAHLHEKKLYLTFNTLMKESEIGPAFETLIAPLYEAGLDAVIVQDLGVMALLAERFPELPIHASTQAAVMGPESAKLLQKLNVTRIVLPREFSLSEIEEFTRAGIETETFVHGALCYCYSGQCLFSSIAGKRSGNRGECAQPCRMEYRFENANGETLSDPREPYLLSLKDLNTLRILPKILATGVGSLKIEGRMKKAEYAAGVTAIYRKYIDAIESHPEAPYRVDPRDEQALFSLFNRNGFTEGYFEKKNGRDMVSLTEKEMRFSDEALLQSIRERYVDHEAKIAIDGRYQFEKGQKGTLTVKAVFNGETVSATAFTEEAIQEAISNPSTDGDARKQLLKTGESGFEFRKLSGTVGENVFLPVSALNRLRRSALEALHENALRQFRRSAEK